MGIYKVIKNLRCLYPNSIEKKSRQPSKGKKTGTCMKIVKKATLWANFISLKKNGLCP